MSKRFHRSNRTAAPIAKKVKSPTILQLIVRLKKTPVAIIHVHQDTENSLEVIVRSDLF
jgi:hypothetical protein